MAPLVTPKLHGNTSTILIRHGVSITPEHIFGVPVDFPKGELLSVSLVRRVELALLGLGVNRFEDSNWHADVHPYGMYDLLSGLSEAQAAEHNVRKLSTKLPDAAVIFAFGVRWDVSVRHRDARIYGPKSDPNNVLLVDLTEKA
jgi:hypothetical protein